MELIIGLGESGSNIAIEYAESRPNNKIIIFNTAKTDLEKIVLERVTKVTVGNGDGSGRNPKVTMSLFSENKERLSEVLKERIT